MGKCPLPSAWLGCIQSWCPHLACLLSPQQHGSSSSPGCTDPWSGWGDTVMGTERHAGGRTCCLCWDPLCSHELSHRRPTRATSAWPPGSQWGCATLATSLPSRTSSRWVALGTGDTRSGCGMSGHGHVPPGKGSDGHLGPGAVGTAWMQAACLAAPCQPCASHSGDRRGPELGAGNLAPALPRRMGLLPDGSAHLLSPRMPVGM